jgi:hypothetical protein
MTSDELRALVQQIVAAKLRDRSGPAARAVSSAPAGAGTTHPSHAVYVSVVNADDACVIEPAVPCNHCNYCRSHGH